MLRPQKSFSQKFIAKHGEGEVKSFETENSTELECDRRPPFFKL